MRPLAPLLLAALLAPLALAGPAAAWQPDLDEFAYCTPTWAIPAPQLEACVSRDNTWYCDSVRFGSKWLRDECFQFVGP